MKSNGNEKETGYVTCVTERDGFIFTKLMQNKGYIHVKRGLNSIANLWTQFNNNITFEISCKIIDVNHCKFFLLLYNILITEN